MSDLLRSEWIKIRTVRVNFILTLIAGAFPLVIVILIAALRSDIKDSNTGSHFVGGVTGTMVVTALLLGVVGALNLTSEYSTGTIRTSFAAVPQRRNMLIAKAIVTVVACTVFAAIVELITYAIGAVILNARGASITLSGVERAAMLGLIVLVAMLVLLGFGLGLIIRNSPAAITTLILWPLLLESIARAVLNAAGVDNPLPWLPYQSAFTMVNPNPDSGDPGRARAGLFLGVIVIAFVVIGTIVNERRDA